MLVLVPRKMFLVLERYDVGKMLPSVVFFLNICLPPHLAVASFAGRAGAITRERTSDEQQEEDQVNDTSLAGKCRRGGGETGMRLINLNQVRTQSVPWGWGGWGLKVETWEPAGFARWNASLFRLRRSVHANGPGKGRQWCHFYWKYLNFEAHDSMRGVS